MVSFSHKCTQTENKVVPSETLNTELKEDIEEATSSPVQTAPFSAKRKFIGSSLEDHHFSRSNKILNMAKRFKPRNPQTIWIARARMYVDMKKTNFMDTKMRKQIQLFDDLKRNKYVNEESDSLPEGPASTSNH